MRPGPREMPLPKDFLDFIHPWNEYEYFRHADSFPFPAQHGLAVRELAGRRTGIVDLQARDHVPRPSLQGVDHRGRRPENVDHHGGAAGQILGGK